MKQPGNLQADGQDLRALAGATAVSDMVVLQTEGLVKRFGGITATNNVSLKIVHGARHALIGPNGAGKTTLINLITGVLAPTEGRVKLDGDDITQLAPHRRVRRVIPIGPERVRVRRAVRCSRLPPGP